MNSPERLTAEQARRLVEEAEQIEARAAHLVLSAPSRSATGTGTGGRSEQKLSRGLLRQADALRRRAQSRRDRAARAQTCGVRVSDHAVVRYIERAYGLDISALYAEILPAAVAHVAARLGDGEYPVETSAGAHLVTVRDGTVVTVTRLGRPHRAAQP